MKELRITLKDTSNGDEQMIDVTPFEDGEYMKGCAIQNKFYMYFRLNLNNIVVDLYYPIPQFIIVKAKMRERNTK